MIERYSNKKIDEIFSDINKLNLWQESELAVLEAQANQKRIPREVFIEIKQACEENPIDIEWWKKRDEEIHHDLNAFLDERLRFIPQELHQYFHKKITSYDTEEPAFATMLHCACRLAEGEGAKIEIIIEDLAKNYRYTIMNARTHGQEAELQSFGARCLTYLVQFRLAYKKFKEVFQENLDYSKMSGAIGKYGSIEPRVEDEALGILGFKPFYGATQIMPRLLYAEIAQAIGNMMAVLDSIAVDIRLGARSGNPILQEPFGKKQKGSSAMPHKKNPIRLEQMEGLHRCVKASVMALTENIGTWEERSIEQSSVERIHWPDLFHLILRAFSVMETVLGGLTVYPDNMLKEIVNSRGMYASSEAKEFIKKYVAEYDLSNEDAYRIVQLASFCLFSSQDKRKHIEEMLSNIPAISLSLATQRLEDAMREEPKQVDSIEYFIPTANLRVVESLDIDDKTVKLYNAALKKIFEDKARIKEWHKLFEPSFLLKHEATLFSNILQKHLKVRS